MVIVAWLKTWGATVLGAIAAVVLAVVGVTAWRRLRSSADASARDAAELGADAARRADEQAAEAARQADEDERRRHDEALAAASRRLGESDAKRVEEANRVANATDLDGYLRGVDPGPGPAPSRR